MSRRDTILVAALLNIGLLLVLLISALKNRDDPREENTQLVIQAAPIPIAESLPQEDLPVIEPIAAVLEETQPSPLEVIVKQGDMLEKIAREHKTSVAAIMKTNNLSSSQLKIGQVLKINPLETLQTPSAKAQEVVLSAIPSNFYTVKTGDNPWTIAVKNHMKVEELLKLNNMSEEKARRLKPGDQIRIR